MIFRLGELFCDLGELANRPLQAVVKHNGETMGYPILLSVIQYMIMVRNL